MKQVSVPRGAGLVVLLLLAAGILVWAGRGWQARSQEPERLRHVAHQLLENLETNDRGQLRRLVSRDYADQLGHDRESACARIMELRGEFGRFDLDFAVGPPAVATNGGTITVTLNDFDADGGPLAAPLAGQLRQIGVWRTPLTTRWQREGFWPGRWRLVELVLPPELQMPAGYQPDTPLREQLRASVVP